MNINIQERRVLASKCGIGDDYLYQILSGRRSCSPELCSALERESKKKITRIELRPNDWQAIWPELAKKHKAAA